MKKLILISVLVSALTLGCTLQANTDIHATAGTTSDVSSKASVLSNFETGAYKIEWASIPGGTFTMGQPEAQYHGPPGSYDGAEHQVTLTPFQMSTTEVTNHEYVGFLNAAMAKGLVKVTTYTGMGPMRDEQVVMGTDKAPADYAGKVVYNLDGTRVIENHTVMTPPFMRGAQKLSDSMSGGAKGSRTSDVSNSESSSVNGSNRSINNKVSTSGVANSHSSAGNNEDQNSAYYDKAGTDSTNSLNATGLANTQIGNRNTTKSSLINPVIHSRPSPFVGVVQPENPLNISYIGYNPDAQAGQWFYVKNPRSTKQFDWHKLCDYYNFTSTPRVQDTSKLLNDYDNWPEFTNFPHNMPTVAQVTNWPVAFVTWYGSKAFADFYNYQLPTEAQWEYAAKGSKQFVYATANGVVNGDGTSANWNWRMQITPTGHVLDVKLNNPNPYGLYNMGGNVWEWLQDWYAKDYPAQTTDPVNNANSGFKVRRGGSWNYHKEMLKTAQRAKDEPFKAIDHFGFRVVKAQ